MTMTRVEGGPCFDTPSTGELAPTATNTTITRMPNIPCAAVRFKGPATNTGNFYIGGSTVTVKAGTTNVKTGLPVAAGDDTGWIFVNNLQSLYYVSDNSSADSLTYMLLS